MIAYANRIDLAVIVFYFIVLFAVGFWKGRGKQSDSSQYFLSKGNLPWWAIGMAYVATGMNSEQLVGQNGMGYTIGLPVVNWYYTTVVPVYLALIFIFFPMYLRNNIITVPQYLGRRFDKRSENVFSIILLFSYIFLSLPVVFYGGAKVMQVIFGWNLIGWLIVLGLVSGLYTMYGGQSSMVYTAAFQFLLIFGAGAVVFILAYQRLPNGWQDVVNTYGDTYHLIRPMNAALIPWHAIPLTLFGLHLFYSCMNQAMVQRGFGAKSEWDVRMAIIFCGFCVFLRPFIEIFPGMIARTLAGLGCPEFALGGKSVDSVFPMIIDNLVPPGLLGLVLIGVLASVMSTIAAFMNSTSTMVTFDVYKKWIRKNADDKELVKVGILATLGLMIFSIAFAPMIEKLGGIFVYFQAAASHLAVPIATVFLMGMFWKRSSPAAALTIMICGIPLSVVVGIILGGIPITQTIPAMKGWVPVFPQEVIERFSLNNFFVEAGITQILCVLIMIGVSLCTKPRNIGEIGHLLWSKDKLFLPAGEPRKPWYKSVGLWTALFILFYALVVAYLW
jgi:solute:Na+ symporter, SSS family